MNILFVKIGAMGDVVMARTLPALAKQRYPEGRFTWMAGRSVAELVRYFHGVDEVLEIDDRAFLAGSRPEKLHALLHAWRQVALHHYDAVLVGHGDWRFRLLARPASASRRRHFVRQPAFPRAGRWHGDEYARLLHGEDGPTVIRPALQPLRPALPKALAARLKGKGKAALFFPGGAKNLLRNDNLRRWPIEHYSVLAKGLQAKGWRIWLGGAASDEWVRPAFKSVPHEDLLGEGGLVQTLGLCAAADTVIAHDSGPLHLAQAARTPTIALFGPTLPSEKVEPGTDTTVFWGGAELACRPCYDGRNFAVCPAPLCLAQVRPEQVLQSMLG
jgi:heptosyltransferase-2